MKIKIALSFAVAVVFGWALSSVSAQDLGPGFTKVKDGIYVFAPDATTTTCSFVVTEEGVATTTKCLTNTRRSTPYYSSV
ncbi:MAG: hypothetical protein ACREQO_25570 [Candidatus Binatia bacterium]